MFIYGVPRREYDSITSICRICWIYDSDWDDENTTDFTRYNSVQDALSRCAKFQVNTCSTDQWMSQLQCNNCVVCILDDMLDNTATMSLLCATVTSSQKAPLELQCWDIFCETLDLYSKMELRLLNIVLLKKGKSARIPDFF